MLVVVTGATGFLGRRLHTWLESVGLEVVGAARPEPSRGGLVPFDPGSEAFRDVLRRGPDILVHAAGGSLIDGSFSDPKQDFLSNTELYLDVLEAVRQFAPACRVVLISSAAVYGNPRSQPVAESTPIDPISPYGFHKAMAEQFGQMYHRIFGLKTSAVRVFSAYGPGLQRQVVYDAIRMLRASGPDHPAVFRGTGQETRDFIHVDDVARGVYAVLQGAMWTGEAYNLASGESATIADLVELVRSLLGEPTAATFDGVPARGHPLAWQADVSRIRSLGFAPAWTLRRGVADLVASWEVDHPGEPA